MECLVAILAYSLTHGTCLINRDTFFEQPLAPDDEATEHKWLVTRAPTERLVPVSIVVGVLVAMVVVVLLVQMIHDTSSLT